MQCPRSFPHPVPVPGDQIGERTNETTAFLPAPSRSSFLNHTQQHPLSQPSWFLPLRQFVTCTPTRQADQVPLRNTPRRPGAYTLNLFVFFPSIRQPVCRSVSQSSNHPAAPPASLTTTAGTYVPPPS